MTISDHLTEFAGLPIVAFDPERGLSNPAKSAIRLDSNYEMQDRGETFRDLLSALLESPGVEQVTTLVIGCWDGAWEGNDSSETVEALVSSRDRLPSLRALFLGEITVDESEISWITQSDISPLFGAFPQMEMLWIRGGNGLSLGRPQHDWLKKLAIETGGMRSAIVNEVCSAHLPALEHLELWLGDSNYGNDVTIEHLAPLFAGTSFPRLRSLGLRDAEQTDEIAKALASAPVVKQLEKLDLSLGTLSDEGAAWLLKTPDIARLISLDLHHHYLTDDMMDRLRRLGPTVNLDERKDPMEYGESHRYVAVSE
jgi:hypothetical protein